jgi:hypothetical protein
MAADRKTRHISVKGRRIRKPPEEKSIRHASYLSAIYPFVAEVVKIFRLFCEKTTNPSPIRQVRQRLPINGLSKK